MGRRRDFIDSIYAQAEGAVAAPSHSHAASDITSGVFDPARLGSGAPGSSTFLRGDGAWEEPAGGGGGGSISYETASLSSNVAMSSSNTWYDGPAVTLGAGTWLLIGNVTHNRSATTAAQVYARITDGVLHHASAQQYHASVNGITSSISCHGVVVLAAETTLTLQCAVSAGNANEKMLAAMTANSAGDNATRLTAIKLT